MESLTEAIDLIDPIPADPAGVEVSRPVGDGAIPTAEYHRLLGRYNDLIDVVIPIGAALFAEKDFDRLLEQILIQTQRLCNADGGTLYLVENDKHLRFAMVRNKSLDFAFGGVSRVPPPFPPLPLRDEHGQENHHNAATHVALTGGLMAIDDVYGEQRFDFSGAKRFDAEQGYSTRSLLTAAVRGSGGKVLGVLQLINATCRDTNRTVPFDTELQRAAGALALLAGSAMEAYVRDLELRNQIKTLTIKIDSAQRKSEVAQITGSDYFQTLSAKARSLRQRSVDQRGA